MGLDMYLTTNIPAPVGSALADIVTANLTQKHLAEMDDPDDGSAYVSGWNFNTDPLFSHVTPGLPVQPDEGSPWVTIRRNGEGYDIEVSILYWRKANAIHQWFVANTQNGVDECQKTLVHPESLMDLLDRCERVAADHSLADALLPSQGGFFFGSTAYDEYYFEDVARTADELRRQIDATPRGSKFFYQSSW